MKRPYVIGIDAGGTKVAYGLFNNSGGIVDRRQHPTDAQADGPKFSDKVVETCELLMAENHLTIDDINGIGIIMPSHILYDEGLVLMTSSMPGIKDFRLRDHLRERLQTNVILDNDANGAALAEHRHGAGRGARHMVYIVIGTGLGSGIIIDGKIFQGSYGWAGECGHMLATPDKGILCGCENKGCYMSYASGKNISERVKAGLEGGYSSILNPETADGYLLNEAYKACDPLAVRMVEQMAHYIGVCTYNIYQLLNINTYVFGGGLVNFGDSFMDTVRKEFNKYNHIRLPVHFRLAMLEKDVGIIGAAEMVASIAID